MLCETCADLIDGMGGIGTCAVDTFLARVWANQTSLDAVAVAFDQSSLSAEAVTGKEAVSAAMKNGLAADAGF